LSFLEGVTVRDFVCDRLEQSGMGWVFTAGKDLKRAYQDVLIDTDLREALIRLNDEIALDPARADEVIYKLRATLLSVRSDGLVRANEEFRSWLVGDRSMPFGPNSDHVPVRLVDFDDLAQNEYRVSTEVVMRSGSLERRFDLVLWVNGIPVAIGEAKRPTRPAVTWVDGAIQIHDDYEQNAAIFFVPNVLSFATDGKEFRFGSIRMPLELWAPWRDDDEAFVGLSQVETAVKGLLRADVLLDILRNFSVYATDKKHRKIKIICRYQQYQAANLIVERVVTGKIKKGLIWHFQGSGKSLLMVFAAQKLRSHPRLRNPTVLIVVDRIELDTQITATFNAADVPNMVATDSRDELQKLLSQDVRKIIITTIHKFAEAPGVLNPRANIIAMVDEAHRTQEGDLGRKMREALPNAFLFGLTGTPINSRDRNTFWAFGADEDEKGYLSRYSYQDSVRDGATLPLHFEPRMVGLRVDKDAIDAEFDLISDRLTAKDKGELIKRAAKLGRLMKAPERVAAITADIAKHFQESVEPNGLKAQVVVYDREACVLYKEAFDGILPPDASEVVMSLDQHDPQDWKQRFERSPEEEERLLDRFRDSADPLKILIVTARLLTGFDAPILQTMYLDKPLRDHGLVQAICRTNRVYPEKTHGLVVDYLGIFDDVAKSLDFDEKSVQRMITNLNELRLALPAAVQACLDYFPGVDRTIGGYEGLIAAQECLPENPSRDEFAAAYSFLSRHWEALSPDPILQQYKEDYTWLTDVYQSLKPPSGQGKLLWHSLGAKTIELINEHVHVDAIRDDLETLVLDPNFLEEIIEAADPRKAREVEVKIVHRLQKHIGDPRFVALGEKLELLRQRHADGQLTSLEFLKQLLELAKDVVKAEKAVQPEEERDQAKAALTELFESVKNENTPILVEKIVSDIDEIVRQVRFPGWQDTDAGKREVRRALRSTLLKYQLHRDQPLFERAYGYIEQYY
jgi:type I restriction enzyme, R subunit